MTFSYDKRADVLYISFEALPPQDYLVVENETGDILKLNKKNGSVVGCTIPFFMERFRKGKIEIPEVGGVPFNALAKDLLRA